MSQSSPAIRIDNADESEKGITLANACRSLNPAERNDACIPAARRQLFPVSDLDGGNATGREFPMSKAQVQLAKNDSKPELVIVAANISH